ncbi:hypothetical protein [Altererythrobacter sp. MF3-039]|uniref:hypothetical protein n=1 Tax=Altererythrobacter sp. MF3-039 TaxID=3252901 RepID=UPI00390CA5B3
MIEVEIQNETHQTQQRLRFAAVPRIGEGIRLLEPNGYWASYDVIDLWYQQADYGDVWVPYLHVRMTPSEQQTVHDENQKEFDPSQGTATSQSSHLARTFDTLEFDPFKT